METKPLNISFESCSFKRITPLYYGGNTQIIIKNRKLVISEKIMKSGASMYSASHSVNIAPRARINILLRYLSRLRTAARKIIVKHVLLTGLCKWEGKIGAINTRKTTVINNTKLLVLKSSCFSSNTFIVILPKIELTSFDLFIPQRKAAIKWQYLLCHPAKDLCAPGNKIPIEDPPFGGRNDTKIFAKITKFLAIISIPQRG